jgi:hypothetical protein
MYKVYLIDYDGSSIELDTEDIDFGLEFKISSLSDLTLRSGNKTKEVIFKGTSTNNQAFGHIYRLGRTSDLNLDNKLFFNYNSLRPVDCLVYQESNLLFRGTLRLIETKRTKGVIYYHTVITDGVIDLMKFTQDRLLSEIDLIDLSHRYTADAITQSWGLQTQRYDTTTGTYSNQPFLKGSGYVYGFVYYGLTLSGEPNSESVFNYRPAMYVKETFDRIFTQDDLTGYTWEILADNDFVDKFNSLVILDNRDKLTTRVSGLSETIYRCTSTYSTSTPPGLTATGLGAAYDTGHVSPAFYRYMLANMRCHSITASNTNVTLLYPITGGTAGNSQNVTTATEFAVWNLGTDIDTDAKVNIEWDYGNNLDTTFTWQLVERPATPWNAGNAFFTWEVVATLDVVGVTAKGIGQPITTRHRTTSKYIPKRQWTSARQFALRVISHGAGYQNAINATASFTIPYTSAEVVLNIPYGSPFTPQYPENIKQYDFMKSIMLMFNLYAYVKKERPKHVIFQTYDDFYALAQAYYIQRVALDWSDKILYNEDWNNSTNLTIPKSYVFTYKEDKDFINKDYKDGFNSVYGQLKFTDRYGVVEEKKSEVVFSPSPLTQVNSRNCPTIRGGDDTTLKTSGSNIRCVYYNGEKPTTAYSLIYSDFLGNIGTASVDNTTYGEVSEYWNTGTSSVSGTSSVFTDSLQFGLPRKLYFPANPTEFAAIPNLYTNYHINRVSELTNSNIYTIDCMVLLSAVDMANFDFQTPIFISTDIGNSYFKVLELSWKDSNTPAKVKLQSIFFGNER